MSSQAGEHDLRRGIEWVTLLRDLEVTESAKNNLIRTDTCSMPRKIRKRICRKSAARTLAMPMKDVVMLVFAEGRIAVRLIMLAVPVSFPFR
jgi:hypothetical protein